MNQLKPVFAAILIGIIGLFLVRITGRIIVSNHTPAAITHDFILNGSRVLVRGSDASNPLLIFIDDTGLPTLPYARTLGIPLLPSYTVVHHDTAAVPALLDTLCRMYPGIPLYLAGHGTGTAACLQGATLPGVTGLILINPPFDRTATDAGIFSFALDAAKMEYNKQAMCELITTDAKTGTSRCAEGTVGSKWMDIFGGRYFNSEYIVSLRRGLFFNPDLTLSEVFRYRSVRPGETAVPLTVPADSIAVPVTVVTGSHNAPVWAAPAAGFFNELKAVKILVTIDSTGYAPHLERADVFTYQLNQSW